jgi:hypothetical protein
VDADGERRLPELAEGAVVELYIRMEAPRVAADDGEGEREAVAGGRTKVLAPRIMLSIRKHFWPNDHIGFL